MEDPHLTSEELIERTLADVKDLSLDELIDRGTMPLMCIDAFDKVKKWTSIVGLRSDSETARNRWDNKTIGADSMMGERSLHNPVATLSDAKAELVELASTAHIRYYTIYMVVRKEQGDGTVQGERVRQTIEMSRGLRTLLEIPSKPKDRTGEISGLLTIVTNRELILGTEDLQRERRQYMTKQDPEMVKLKLHRLFTELVTLAGIENQRSAFTAALVNAHNDVFDPLGWGEATNTDSFNP